MENEITTKTNRQSLMAMEKNYITSIANGMKDIIGSLNNYQSLCAYNILASINNVLAKKGLNHLSQNVDKESINNAIKFCAIYGLNVDNREVFVSTRNEKRVNEVTQKDYWITVVECKPQYKGQLKIVSTFGRDVERVYPEWVVREGDEFTYPTFIGVERKDPTWTPKGSSNKILRVVVPIKYKDGSIDYRIAERESLATNIKAQVKQALMGDKARQKQVIALIQDMTLDQLLNEPSIADVVNETYTGISKEEMFITKLVINATKRIIIDYESALQRELLEKTFDNADVYKKSHSATDILDQQLTPLEMQETPKEITTDNDGVVVAVEEIKESSSDKHELTKDEELSMEQLLESIGSN